MDLFSAAKDGNTQRVNELIKTGVNVNRRNGTNHTALMYASTQGHLKVVKALIEAGADVNSPNPFGGITALMYASMRGYSGVVKALIKARANLNQHEHIRGRTALMLASEHPDVVRELVRAGADTSIRDFHDETALIRAARRGCADTVLILINGGADLNELYTTNEQGKRVLLQGLNPQIQRNIRGLANAQELHKAALFNQLNQLTRHLSAPKKSHPNKVQQDVKTQKKNVDAIGGGASQRQREIVDHIIKGGLNSALRHQLFGLLGHQVPDPSRSQKLVRKTALKNVQKNKQEKKGDNKKQKDPWATGGGAVRR